MWVANYGRLLGNLSAKVIGENIKKKIKNVESKQNWILHHDNALAHTSYVAVDFLITIRTVLEIPLILSDLAPVISTNLVERIHKGIIWGQVR